MRKHVFAMLVAVCAAFIVCPLNSTIVLAQAPAPPAAPPAPPPVVAPALPAVFTVDLMTAEGTASFSAQWKNMDARIVEGPAMPGAGAKWTKSYDLDPHAGEAGYDDSSWPTIEAKDLAVRRGGGKLFFTWYRTNLTIPARIGSFDTNGAMVVLRVLVDDYAEVWVDGQMPRALGRPSPGAIQGFNMPNRIVLKDSVKPGDKFQVAIFGINGPISVAPLNTVWFREAKIEFYK
jgi:gluconolactonase